jgi:hypothetical protein
MLKHSRLGDASDSWKDEDKKQVRFLATLIPSQPQIQAVLPSFALTNLQSLRSTKGRRTCGLRNLCSTSPRKGVLTLCLEEAMREPMHCILYSIRLDELLSGHERDACSTWAKHRYWRCHLSILRYCLSSQIQLVQYHFCHATRWLSRSGNRFYQSASIAEVGVEVHTSRQPCVGGYMITAPGLRTTRVACATWSFATVYLHAMLATVYTVYYQVRVAVDVIINLPAQLPHDQTS